MLLSSTLVLSLGLSALPAPALALPNDACIKDERCKEHHDKAVNYYNQQYFEEALSEFQAAYAARQMPLLLINIGRTLQKLGRPKEAINYYERFQQAESKPDPAVQTKVNEYLNQAKALVGTDPTPPPSEQPSETPKPPTTTPVTPPAVAPPPPPPPAPPPPGRSMIIAGGVLAGIGVLGLVTGIGLYAKSASDYSTFQTSNDEFDQLAARSSAQAFGAGSTASYIVGTALVGVGAILIGVGARKLVAHRRSSAPAAHAALVPGPSGVTAVLTGAF